MIDLSSPSLRPDAVIMLIQDHARNPGPQQLLFKVSEEVHQRFRAANQDQMIDVTPTEALEISRFAGLEEGSQAYQIGKRHECTQCGRVITFYDIFKTGRKHHGDDYLRRFIGGEGYHIQVHQINPVLEVECAKCGLVNRFDDGCYQCGNYTYA